MTYGDPSKNRTDQFNTKDRALDMLRFKESNGTEDCYEIMEGEADLDLGKEDTVYLAYCDEAKNVIEAEYNVADDNELKEFNSILTNKNNKILIFTKSSEMFDYIKENKFDENMCDFESNKLYIVVCQEDDTATITTVIPGRIMPLISPSIASYTIEEMIKIIQKNPKAFAGVGFLSNHIDWVLTAIIASKRYTCKNNPDNLTETREVSLLCFDGFMCEQEDVASKACLFVNGGSYCQDGECVSVDSPSCELGQTIALGLANQTITVFLDNKNCNNEPCVTDTPQPSTSPQ